MEGLPEDEPFRFVECPGRDIPRQHFDIVEVRFGLQRMAEERPADPFPGEGRVDVDPAQFFIGVGGKTGRRPVHLGDVEVGVVE